MENIVDEIRNTYCYIYSNSLLSKEDAIYNHVATTLLKNIAYYLGDLPQKITYENEYESEYERELDIAKKEIQFRYFIDEVQASPEFNAGKKKYLKDLKSEVIKIIDDIQDGIKDYNKLADKVSYDGGYFHRTWQEYGIVLLITTREAFLDDLEFLAVRQENNRLTLPQQLILIDKLKIKEKIFIPEMPNEFEYDFLSLLLNQDRSNVKKYLSIGKNPDITKPSGSNTKYLYKTDENNKIVDEVLSQFRSYKIT